MPPVRKNPVSYHKSQNKWGQRLAVVKETELQMAMLPSSQSTSNSAASQSRRNPGHMMRSYAYSLPVLHALISTRESWSIENCFCQNFFVCWFVVLLSKEKFKNGRQDGVKKMFHSCIRKCFLPEKKGFQKQELVQQQHPLDPWSWVMAPAEDPWSWVTAPAEDP